MMLWRKSFEKTQREGRVTRMNPIRIHGSSGVDQSLSGSLLVSPCQRDQSVPTGSGSYREEDVVKVGHL